MSTSIIDALVVTLGLDAAQYKAGSKQARGDLKSLRDDADKTAKNLADKGREASQFFRELRNQAIAFFAVLTAGKGLENLIRDTTEANAAMGLLAKNVGVATTTIMAWGNAADIAGGSASGMQNTMSMLSGSMTEMQVTGQSAILPYLRALGVNMADAAGRARPLDDVLLDLADRFSGMDRVTANNFGKMMGIDQGTMNLLLQGRKAVEAQIRQQKELHQTTAAEAEQALKLHAAFSMLRQSADSVGRTFVAWLTPGLTDLFGWMKKLGEWIGQNQGTVIGFLTELATVLTVLLAPALFRAAAGMIALTWPFLLIAAAILLATLALDDWYTWLRGGPSLFGDFWQAISNGWKSFSSGWEWAKKVFRDFWNGIITDVRMLAPEIGEALKKGFLDAFDSIKKGWNATKRFFGLGGSSPSASATPSGSGPRGIRNNNPGNLNFAGQKGATKEGGANGRFAVFGTMEEGVGALGRQLRLYASRGTDTIRKIVKKYAPAGDGNNVGAYISSLVKATGMGADDALNLDDAKTMQALVKGIISHENGSGHVSDAQIAAGLGGGGSRGPLAPNPGALASAAPAGARASASMVAANNNTRVNSETHIQEINIHTAATDAKGIAKDIGGAIKSQGLIYQADQGLT